ncbi:MAG TPA: radical SAM protein, partial [Desulfocapsa sulfexigens]|nr:radical SAM protein [Desulfocapsa sulfexigens]
MKVLLISMPDVVPILVHEAAVHIPNLGIASIGGNIDPKHDVYLVDLIRKRRSVKKYLTKIIGRITPDLVGLSAMAWQFDTCIKIAHLIKELRPE